MKRVTEGTRGLSRLGLLIVLFGLSAALTGTALAAREDSASAPAPEARYAGMPDPEAMDAPVVSSDHGSGTIASYTVGAATARLSGTQTLYRIDNSGLVTDMRRADMGAAMTFLAREGVQVFGGRPYIRLIGGRFADWWVAAPAAALTELERYSPPAQIELARGTHLGVRFYANGTVRTRRPVVLSTPATFEASRRATFNGRSFFPAHQRTAAGSLGGPGEHQLAGAD